MKAKNKITANDLTRYVILSGMAYGFILWRNNNGAVYDRKKNIYRKNPQHKKGVFDVIGFQKKTGKHTEFEIKVGRDKMSIYQEQHLQELTANGCFCEVFSHPAEVDSYFNEIMS